MSMLRKLRDIISSVFGWVSENRFFSFYIILSLLIILYTLPLLLTGTKIAPGDADYLMQTVEAARISIFEYGQFPWWNPWINGGVPLFANPQFGLISLPTLFGFIFGSVLGYKIALLAYLLIGFWGFYILFTKCFKTPKITAVLLGLIWTFGSFFAYRSGGHFTFFTIEFFPLLLFFFLQRKTMRRSWLWLGLIIGVMINTAAHNTTIMALAVFGIFVLIELCKILIQITKKSLFSIKVSINFTDLLFLLKAGGIALILSWIRIYYTFSYIREYPRNLTAFPEDTVGVFKALFAMFGPIRQYTDPPLIPNWSWMEVSAYIGFFTGIVAVICLISILKEKSLKRTRAGRVNPLVIIVLGCIFFSFGLGLIAGQVSPYSILQHLPVFSEMRVASRWIVWSSMMVLVFIALYTSARYRKLINVLLAISVCELFIFGSLFIAKPFNISPTAYPKSSTIDQRAHYDTQRQGATYDENLTATTSSNIGQVIAGDALIDTRNKPPFGANTVRCDESTPGCAFIISNNASVKKWSPNYIELVRTAPGEIVLNINPGKYWLVNNKYPFHSMRLAEPDKNFVIDEEEETLITIKMQPKYSLDWWIWKILGN